MSELSQWIAEEFILELGREIAAQRRVVDDIEAIEQNSLENHLQAVDERRKLRRLLDARARLRKDVQPKLF